MNNIQKPARSSNRKPRKPIERKYNFSFTYFYKDMLEVHELLRKLHQQCNYVIFGIEECPTTFKHHVQGYFSSKEPISLNVAKLWIPRAHLEFSTCTPRANYEYCSKSGITLTRGSISKVKLDKP